MMQAPGVPRLVPVSKRDSNAVSDGDSIVLPADHVSGGLKSGFSDRYYFTRVFTKHRQTSPAAFRREAKA